MKKSNTIEIIICIIILIILVWFIFFSDKDKDKEIIIQYEYVTDTIWSDTIWIAQDPLEIITQPSTIVIYKLDSSSIDSLKLILNEREIIITGLKDSISISHLYLKQFPINPKLLGLNLVRDTLDISLLNISGQISKNTWPIDLNRFNYHWDSETTLTRQPLKISKHTNNKPLRCYLGGGLDLLYQSPYLSGQIEKDLARIRLYSNISVGLLDSKSSSIKIGARYRVWQNQK